MAALPPMFILSAAHYLFIKVRFSNVKHTILVTERDYINSQMKDSHDSRSNMDLIPYMIKTLYKQ